MSYEAEENALVEELAVVMRQKLAENRRKPHWRQADLGYLTRRIYDEARELSRAIKRGATPAEVRREAADVANFAAMVADLYNTQSRGR
jgi:NTP pyrophosphatase (non-canonical NTP hydrolase)